MGTKGKINAPPAAAIVLQPLRHDGRDYWPGEPLPEMDETAAQQLIELGVATPEHPFPQIDNAP